MQFVVSLHYKLIFPTSFCTLQHNLFAKSVGYAQVQAPSFKFYDILIFVYNIFEIGQQVEWITQETVFTLDIKTRSYLLPPTGNYLVIS